MDQESERKVLLKLRDTYCQTTIHTFSLGAIKSYTFTYTCMLLGGMEVALRNPLYYGHPYRYKLHINVVATQSRIDPITLLLQ